MSSRLPWPWSFFVFPDQRDRIDDAVTQKQTPDRKAAATKPKGASSPKSDKKNGAKPAAKAKDAKAKPTDLKSILKAMVKPLPPPKPKPALAKGAASPQPADGAKSANQPSGKQMAK